MSFHSLSPHIYFEDPHLIVLSKPSGLLSQGERTGDENLVDWLRAYLGRPYVGLVHRLDRNTSGLMVVAKRTKAAQRLTKSLQEGKIVRIYQAWLVGKLEAPARWIHFLKKDERTNLVKVVSRGTSGGKEAILDVIPIRHAQWRQTEVTLAEFILDTGRSHQIRVQSAYSGFPVLGDTKYVSSMSKGSKGEVSKVEHFPRLALHSSRLTFPHPMSQEILTFQEPFPEEKAYRFSAKA